MFGRKINLRHDLCRINIPGFSCRVRRRECTYTDMQQEQSTSGQNDSDTNELLDAVRDGRQPDAINRLFTMHRERLLRMVRCRLDPRLYGRVDDSDVIQEGFLEAAKHINEYCRAPRAPFFLWLRRLVGYKLLEIHRHHLGVEARNAARDISIYGGPLPEATTTKLAEQLLGKLSSPSQTASRAEMTIQLQQALNQMERLDREVIALRHFEHMSNAETALALEISEAAASSRYLRAMKRLRKLLQEYVSFFED